MNLKTEKFLLKNIRRSTHVSNEIRADRNITETEGPIKSCDVECLICRHKWQAHDYGINEIRIFAGGFMLNCPNCSAAEDIFNKNLTSK